MKAKEILEIEDYISRCYTVLASFNFGPARIRDSSGTKSAYGLAALDPTGQYYHIAWKDRSEGIIVRTQPTAKMGSIEWVPFPDDYQKVKDDSYTESVVGQLPKSSID